MAEIRKLKASEIECRVAQVGQTQGKVWASILLYKDARVDQRILDETYGPMNWERKHEIIQGRLYCSVGVWDAEKGRFVYKQDVGVESYTEKEKGQASDSFKRACFNWGIGRELYTAPSIFIYLNEGEFYMGKDNKPKTRFTLSVSQIGYDADGVINHLVLRDKKGNVRFNMNKNSKPVASTTIAKTETVAQPQQGKALPFEEYFKVVAAHAKGIKAKNGISMRDAWILNTYPTQREIEAFDEAVLNYNKN